MLIRHDPAHLGDTHRDLMDVFERVLREGGVFDVTDSADMPEGSTWLKVSIAGVDVLKAVASLSWRRLLREN
jgi:hypothetical protein